MIAVVSLALFLSGAAGLIFEIVWFDRASLVFGSGVVAAAVVLSSFMGGLAIGNAIVGWIGAGRRRLIHIYAGLEATIAATGIALTYALRAIESHPLPLGSAFLLLLVPAGAMGATLPILVAACRRQRAATFGWTLGTLYGWNTLGAVCGVLVADTMLIAILGITGTAWIAGALNVLAAVVAVAWAGPSDQSAREGAGVGHAARRIAFAAWPSALCAALAGVTLLALEVIWLRFLSTFVLTTTMVMSAILAVVLAGIALGGLAGAQWTKRRDAAGLVPAVAAIAGASVAWTYSAFAVATAGTQVGSMARAVWFAIVLTFPTAMASGILFALVGASMRRTVEDDARAAATLTLANTVGAMCGAPVAAFALLPRLGTERALLVLAVAYVVIGLVAWLGRIRPTGRPSVIVTALAALVAGVTLIRFPLGLMATTFSTRVAAAYEDDGSRIIAVREGPTESILLLQQRWMGRPVYSRLVTNGFSMSGTAIPGQRYMRYFVYWPLLMHTAPLQRILVMCYGVGVTAGAALEVPSTSSVDIVEISRDVAAMSDVVYAGGGNPLRDPRAVLHIDDGRHFLFTTSERFDLITGEPPPPRTPGAVNIYTREYFQLIRDRLADGGMTTYWLPVARPRPGTDVNTVIRAFCDVFADCSLWNATPFDLMLVGSRGTIGRFDTTRFDALRDRFAEVGFETPEQIGATFIGDAAYLNDLTAGTPALTDDFPQRLRPVDGRASLSDPRYPSDPAVVAEYQNVLDPRRARTAFEQSGYIKRLWPADAIASTLPWFDEQATINRVLWEGGNPRRLIEVLDAVLTRTTLRTLPLWILGTDAVKQRIAASGNDGTGTVEFLRGVQLLAERDYESAASYFGLADRRGLRAPAVRPMVAYALCKAGRREMSGPIVAAMAARDDDDRHFVEWMRANCGGR